MESKQQQENKMGKASIPLLLLQMSWPAVLSMMVYALYSVVDGIFVAQTGEASLTAVTLTFPVQIMIIAVAAGTGVGINSLIARKLGEKAQEEANLAAGNGLRLAGINWMVFALLGVLFSGTFMRFFTDDPLIFIYGKQYLMIITVGSLFIFVQITLEKMIQSTGDMITPMIFIVTGGLLNVVLDPLLIFGLGPFPSLGVIGAAVATVIAEACGMAIALILVGKKSFAVTIDPRIPFHKKTVKEVYLVAAPAILMHSMVSLLNFFFNSILAGFSATAVAVYGIYGRIQDLIFMPVFGINQGAMPLLGYNYGAKNRTRLLRGFFTAFSYCLVLMALGLVFFQWMPEKIMAIFSPSSVMMEMGIGAFRTLSLSFIPASFGIISTTLFIATGHGFFGLWASVIRQFVGILPLAYFFGKTIGLKGVWWAYPGGDLLGLLYVLGVFFYLYKREYRRLTPGDPLVKSP